MTANAQLSHALLVNLYSNNTFMLWWIILENIILICPPTLPVWSFKLTCLTTNIISIGTVIFLVIYFHRTPAWVYVLHLRLQFLLVSFVFQSLRRFQYNLYYCLPYACSTRITIFRLILSFKITPESILQSRVKHCITPISVVIFHEILNEDFYNNVNMILHFYIILFMSCVEFFKVWL